MFLIVLLSIHTLIQLIQLYRWGGLGILGSISNQISKPGLDGELKMTGVGGVDVLGAVTFNVGAETLNQRKEKERCRQDRREKKGLESGGRYRMGSLEDPCVPQAQGPGKQWKDKAFEEGMPGLRRDHFHSSCQVPWVSCASVHLHHIPFPCLLWCIRVAYVSSQEQENKHHRGDKLT